MDKGRFLRFVGDPAVHDAEVEAVRHEGDHASVTVRGPSGRRLIIEFLGVTHFHADNPEGMLLYSLSEMEAPAPLRHFVFTNWDDEDNASLEVVAREFSSVWV